MRLKGLPCYKPVEYTPPELAELTREIPQNYGVWRYRNWWARHGPDGSISADMQYVGVGARFGSSGHMFHSITNPGGDILIRDSPKNAFVYKSQKSIFWVFSMTGKGV